MGSQQVTVEISVPIKMSSLHPDLGSVLVYCSVAPPGGNLNSGPANMLISEAKSAELPLANGAVDGMATVSGTGTLAPNLAGQQATYQCDLYGCLRAGVQAGPRPERCQHFMTRNATGTIDPRFRLDTVEASTIIIGGTFTL